LRVHGEAEHMIGVAIAFIIVGIVFLFIVPWVGIPVGILGLVLAVLWIAGFGRRAATRETPTERTGV
jgi:Flp pilus assembly protein TadB